MSNNIGQVIVTVELELEETKFLGELQLMVRTKRVLDYGVRAPVFYGNLRERKGENGFPR